MGKLCSKFSQSEKLPIEVEKEISIPSFKSIADKDYELIEHKYNFLNKLSIIDYIHSLSSFTNENATLEDDYLLASLEHSMNDDFYNERFSVEMFQSFIENKLLKHKLLYENSGNNEKATGIFKEILIANYNGLALKLSQNAKENGNETADKQTIAKKSDLIPLGILYCSGYNYSKVRLIFNLFKSNDSFKFCEQFSNFLLSLFLTASYGMANSRNKTSKFDEIGGIDSGRLKELLNTSELRDCQNLVKVTNKLIFGENLSISLTYEEFKSKFSKTEKENSLGFLLSPSGVRFMLQENNVS